MTSKWFKWCYNHTKYKMWHGRCLKKRKEKRWTVSFWCLFKFCHSPHKWSTVFVPQCDQHWSKSRHKLRNITHPYGLVSWFFNCSLSCLLVFKKDLSCLPTAFVICILAFLNNIMYIICIYNSIIIQFWEHNYINTIVWWSVCNLFIFTEDCI